MKLYWCPKTRASRIVWMLEELDEPYERVLVDLSDKEAPRPAGFLEASPMGKVPALADGEVKMSESAAICLYVADRYSSGKLAPTLDHPDRGRFLYWMMFTPACSRSSTSLRIASASCRQVSFRGWSSRTKDQLRMVTGPVSIPFRGLSVSDWA